MVQIEYHGFVNIVVYALPIKAYVKHVTPRMGPFWQHGHNLNNLVEESTT